MNIYDQQILNVLTLLKEKNSQKLDTKDVIWQDVGKQNLVLRNEMSYELGGEAHPAVSFLGVTSSKELVNSDGASLYGKNLAQINENSPYARITLLRIDDELMGKGEKIYDAMGRLINTRYQVNPKGFMSRISTSSKHEPVRVSATALEEGLSFEKVARLYVDAYKRHKEVIAAQVIFITLSDFNYDELSKIAQKNDEITAALDHVLRDIRMDCSSCKLQPICNEVEGLKELHFKTEDK